MSIYVYIYIYIVMSVYFDIHYLFLSNMQCPLFPRSLQRLSIRIEHA